MVTINDNVVYILTLEDILISLAEDFTRRAIQAVQSKGAFTVVLSGGNTPKSFFDKITKDNKYKKQIPWQQIKFFFSDERYVPSNNIESNYNMAYEHLFSKVPILDENIYRVPTEFKEPEQAARDYEATIKKVFHIKEKEFPSFDIIYLGLGADAHTASLMPMSEIPKNAHKSTDSEESNPYNHDRLVIPLWVETLKMYRITLTPAAINHAMNIIFLVIGKKKASAVWKVLEGKKSPNKYPAQLIHCINNKNIWYVDKEAASQLSISH